METTGERVLAILSSHRLEQIGQGEYKCDHPLKVGSDSQAFTLTINPDGEHGAFYYFPPDTGGTIKQGTLYELADALGVPKGDAQDSAIIGTKRGYRSLREYALVHGVEPEVFEAAGWREEEHYTGRPALSFPTESGKRFRFLDGKKPRFIHADKGYTRCWYGLNRVLAGEFDSSRKIVICNGEPSVVVAQHFGIPAITVGGGGEKPIPDYLLEQLVSTWRNGIFVALERDGAKMAQTIAAQFKGGAQVVDLGMMNVHEDLGDLCKLHGFGSYDYLVNRAAKPVEVVERENTGKDLQQVSRELNQAIRSQNGSSMPELIGDMRRKLDGLAAQYEEPVIVGPGEADTDFAAYIEGNITANERGDTAGVMLCGIPGIDEGIGGFGEHETITILCESNMGKTMVSASIAAGLLQHSPGLIIPAETTPNRYKARIIGAITGVHASQIIRGTLRRGSDEYRRVARARVELADAGTQHFLRGFRPGIEEVMKGIEIAQKEHGIKWVLIDSMDRVRPTKWGGIFDETREKSKRLQDAALQAGLCVIRTSQTKEFTGPEAVYRIPTMWSGKGGRDIAEDSDKIIGVWNYDRLAFKNLIDGSKINRDKYPQGGIALMWCKLKEDEYEGYYGVFHAGKGTGLRTWDERARAEFSSSRHTRELARHEQ